MELSINRKWLTNLTSISELLVNGKSLPKQIFILEDTDRGLSSSMKLENIKKIKIAGLTAIPTGRYQVILSFSPKYQKIMPLVANVPGYEGIRIHPGNYSTDTEGCLLPGFTRDKDFVGNSKAAFSVLQKLITDTINQGENIYITITNV